MAVGIAIFFTVFILIGSVGLLIFYRETIQARISAAINPPQAKQQKTIKTTLQDTRDVLEGVVERFEKVVPKSEQEKSVAQQRLVMAGYREDSAIKVLYGVKVILPLVLAALVLITGIAGRSFFLIIACLGVGFIGPDFILGKMISSRQAKIKRGLPDVLDMLVICVEAGLSMDQATARTAEELRQAQPELSDELTVVALEQRAGATRADAWKHLADRTGVDVVRNLVSMLVQSEQFGTSVAKTLRVHSDTLRTKRVQEIEEKAAKLSVKLLFPLVFFIFPSLFVVVLGPAVIMMSESFKKLFGH
ncbi:MAG TPA: type II secretion system F family protein [Terracidiphilus sp.]|nr:type II secretion system F family protein [Terracidiphilus sp.]